METTTEKRRVKRIKTQKRLRIYSSVSRIPYTVEIYNLSEKGASVKTKFIPQINETISFEAVDNYVQKLHYGHGKVTWVKNTNIIGESGFGIEFDDDFPLELIN